MRYDEMKALYPWIEDYFAFASDQVHGGAPPARVLALLELQVGRIPAKHRNQVLGKLRQFVRVIAPVEEPEPGTPQPELCPFCGALERWCGGCGWCRGIA